MTHCQIYRNHCKDGTQRHIFAISCLLLMSSGCAPTASFVYHPSKLSYGIEGLGRKKLLVLRFQDARERAGKDPKLIGKCGPLISIYADKTVTEVVTSAVASELKSAGFSVDTLGAQAGVRKEDIAKLLTEYGAKPGETPKAVIWGTINKFFYRGGSFNKATVEIVFDLVAPDGRHPIHSNQQSCTASARGEHLAVELFTPLVMTGHFERNFAVSLLTECMQKTVRQGLTDQELVQKIRRIFSEPSKQTLELSPATP